ncbi:MAG: hypothetical protein JO016_06835 [Actinobacteria bacterium]|nr:hypothetical protein [Actinomycetota bacterium]
MQKKRFGSPLVQAAAVAVGVTTAALTGMSGAGAAVTAPANHGSSPSFTVTRIASGQRLTHSFTAAGSGQRHQEHLTSPDDITMLRGRLYVAFQNGVGPQGQASTDGNRDSTVVEFTTGGREIRQWDLTGKCDGLTADPQAGIVVATINEDANSSLDTVTPAARPGHQIGHYAYSEPLPHHGGTDAISVYHGQLLVSASAPGTSGAAAPNPAYPAVYAVALHGRTHVAAVRPLFYDEASATVANTGATAGKTVKLALTDPDSNEIVPSTAPRFGGDFMLTSQGDKEQIYVRHAGARRQSLAVLRLSQSVDDTAWVTGPGRIFTTDNSQDYVDTVTGSFRPGAAFVAVTPCDASNAPATCPAPPAFPANYLGQLNMSTGHISKVTLSGPSLQPQGMIFAPGW